MNKKNELRNCANCLFCKQSKESTPLTIWAFCSKKKKRVEYWLDYWMDKPTCHYLEDMGK